MSLCLLLMVSASLVKSFHRERTDYSVGFIIIRKFSFFSLSCLLSLSFSFYVFPPLSLFLYLSLFISLSLFIFLFIYLNFLLSFYIFLYIFISPLIPLYFLSSSVFCYSFVALIFVVDLRKKKKTNEIF